MFDAIVFASPYLFGFFIVMPILWWLLRLTPPSPRKVIFPAIAFLRDIASKQETPARTPWWLVLLRLVAVAMIILSFTDPLIHPHPLSVSKGPLFIVVDNDWASARDWGTRQKILHALVQTAENDNRSIVLLTTAPPDDGSIMSALGPLAPQVAENELRNLKPEPWPSDWAEAERLVSKLNSLAIADTVWVASGIGNDAAKSFYDHLQKISSVRVIASKIPIYVSTLKKDDADIESLVVSRASAEGAASLTIDAIASDGNILARMPISFTPGSPRALLPIKLPVELRNQIVRFQIDGVQTAASLFLLDSAWGHRTVGLVGEQADLEQHSLLSSLYYIDRALKPFADLHLETLDQLLKEKAPVIILSDTTIIADTSVPSLTAWVKAGGILIRFAGERLLTNANPELNDLLPVTLMAGDRTLGGALTWATPQKLHVFPTTSPFAGLAIPDDVTVNRQILAEPSTDLPQKTWAALEDGTPLVTAKPVGQGLSVLFHIPAQSEWSNVPLSGLFVDMLRRIVDLSSGGHDALGTSLKALPPFRTLDAFGMDQQPGSAVEPLDDQATETAPIGPHHPPGLFGTAGFTKAVNLGAAIGQPELLSDVAVTEFLFDRVEVSLKPYLLMSALIILWIDFLISLLMRGAFSFYGRRATALAFVFSVALLPQSGSAADDKTAIELTSKTYLAHIHTGDRETDTIAESGLTTLARVLQLRTSIDHVGVADIDPNTDDLAFFPLVYWPLIAGEAPLSLAGVTRVNDYLRHGGMILFDTMDGEDPSPLLVKRILSGVDMPPLIHLPEDHVLKRSFYLINDAVGRFANPNFWLEPEDASSNDGVATVLFGSNGWASAWATDNEGKALYPCTPGGESQREQSLRFGVNLVMYALTGNYKSDQLHMQALLEKMGK